MSTLISFRDIRDFRDRKLRSKNNFSRSLSSSSRYSKEDIQYLAKMRRNSSYQKVVCKNGPNCVNHDWDKRSPIIKVCTRDINCVNHDWRHVDRHNSPFKVICKKGPACLNHAWNNRSPMQRRLRVLKTKCKTEKKEKTIETLP